MKKRVILSICGMLLVLSGCGAESETKNMGLFRMIRKRANIVLEYKRY